VLCQPTVLADSKAEPTPPAGGVARDVFYDFLVDAGGEDWAKAFWKWWTVTYPDWGREGWKRLDAARALPPCSPSTF